MRGEAGLLADLGALAIPFAAYEHEAVFTVAESDAVNAAIPGAHTKNLFLKDNGGAFWLVTVPSAARVDLKALPAAIMEALVEEMELERAAIWLKADGDALTLAGQRGRFRIALPDALSPAGNDDNGARAINDIRTINGSALRRAALSNAPIRIDRPATAPGWLRPIAGGSGCQGVRPWLHDRQTGCTERPRTIQRGASNVHFPVVCSALSIPPASEAASQIVQEVMPMLQHMPATGGVAAEPENTTSRVVSLSRTLAIRRVLSTRRRTAALSTCRVSAFSMTVETLPSSATGSSAG